MTATEAVMWSRAGPEPALEDLLADPTIGLILRRDRLTPADVRAAVEAARRRLAQAAGADAATNGAREERRDE